MAEAPPVVAQLSATSTAAMCEIIERNPYPLQFFRLLDEDRDGKIGKADLQRWLLAQPEVLDDTSERLFRSMDLDKEGGVTADEFCAVWHYVLDTQRGLRELFNVALPRAGMDRHELFSRIDRNSDGQISVAELVEWLSRMTGYTHNPWDEAGRIVAAMDRDADQRISKEEWEEAYQRVVVGGGGGVAEPAPAAAPAATAPDPAVPAIGEPSRHGGTTDANAALGGAFRTQGVPNTGGGGGAAASEAAPPARPARPPVSEAPPASGRMRFTYEWQDVPAGYERLYGLPAGLQVQTVLGGGVPNRAKIPPKWQLRHMGCAEGIWRHNDVARGTTGLQLRQSAARCFGREPAQVRLRLGDYPNDEVVGDEQTVEEIDLFNRQAELRLHLG